MNTHPKNRGRHHDFSFSSRSWENDREYIKQTIGQRKGYDQLESILIKKEAGICPNQPKWQNIQEKGPTTAKIHRH